MAELAPRRDDVSLTERYLDIRRRTIQLCAPLEADDYGVQPMADASPPKWHLAHTTWFFETFILKAYRPDHRPYNDAFEYLFNSYYNAVGEQFPRAQRGRLSRPTTTEITQYRHHVDAAMTDLLADAADSTAIDRTILGLHHEQQHQELIVTDLKNNLGTNPLYPAYAERRTPRTVGGTPPEHRFIELPGGLIEIGAAPARGEFAFDNEQPRHRVYLQPYELGSRLVTNGEYREFISDGGYRRPELWLSEGWGRLGAGQLGAAPLYWQRNSDQRDSDEWLEYTLSGLAPLQLDVPVVHVSYFEADAFAHWRGARLPTEFEWEHAASQRGADANTGAFADDACFHPQPAAGTAEFAQLFGDAWEWTASAYAAYPGFESAGGALGEYNGKFMSSQMVLRGGSCATPRDHVRATYRNFFYPGDRWQFSGIRLARDV